MDPLEGLRRLPVRRIAVQHQPETPRYRQARQVVEYIVREAQILGSRAAEGGPADRIEVALWARPPSGRGHGFYACMRLYVEAGEPYYAILFCFYDGTEASPGFRSLEAARTFALSQGFTHED